MNPAAKNRGYMDYSNAKETQLPASSFQTPDPQYLDPVSQGEYMMAMASNSQQTVPSTIANVYDDCRTITVPPPAPADQPRQKDNSSHKISLLLGGVSLISLVVAFAALAMSSALSEKQNSLPNSMNATQGPVIGIKEEKVPQSCLEILVNGETRSGIFAIHPQPNGTSFSTFCDMTSGGGGWTLVASVHENNIDGKCTVGDKWSSEQGIEYSSFEASGSWENYDVFGDILSVTSSDYKNPAYFNLEASDIMLWHVPNDVNIDDIEEQAFLKYYTSDGFLAENGSTFRNFFAYHAPLEKVSVSDLRAPLSDNAWLERLRAQIPNFYSYTYDRPTLDYIDDGGGDMYDRGNKVSFAVNNDSYISVTYGERYGNPQRSYSAISAAVHPFLFLFQIGFEGLDSFKLRVTSDAGADGRGSILTYNSSFHYSEYVVGYGTFHIYNAGDPSICEVYFYISSPQKWKSIAPQVNYTRWSTSTNTLDNEIQLRGAKNILAGYTLLSRSSGSIITESQVISVLRIITDRLRDIQFPEAKRHFAPITFERGSVSDVMARVPTSQEHDVTAGYIEFKAIDEFGYPYALCPGVYTGLNATPSVHCLGGINSNWNETNPSCGDFADWNKGGNASYHSPSATGRSLQDIQSSILIFTRNGK